VRQRRERLNLTMLSEDYEDPTKRERVFVLLGSMEASLGECAGILVDDSEVQDLASWPFGEVYKFMRWDRNDDFSMR
jgi:hypothetical protein